MMQATWMPGAELAVMGVRGEDAARAVLYGHGISGEDWASVPCEAGLAEAGGAVTFQRRLEGRGAVMPDAFRIWSRGKLLRECVFDRSYAVSPGDSVTVHVPRRLA